MSNDKLDKKMESMPHAHLSPKQKEKMLHTIINQADTEQKPSWKKAGGWLAPIGSTFAVILFAFILIFPNANDGNQASLEENGPEEISQTENVLSSIQLPTGTDLYLLFFITVMLIAFILTVIIRIKHKIPYDFLSVYRHVNKTHKRGELLLILIFITITLLSFFVFSYREFYVLLSIFCTILLGYRSYMEFKHEREEKEFMISLIWGSGWFTLFIGFLFFTLHITTFDEVIANYESVNPENTQVIEIENNAWNEDATSLLDEIITKEEFIIEDKETINDLFSALNTMDLRQRIMQHGDKDNYYSIYFKGSDIYAITVYEQYLSIDSQHYKVVGNNIIYEMLENGELD
ncbi:DUF4181 domain-containing protein [Ornithinibacillus halophilus]|uniref:DUF4181 domain-containing protein n=1 Tax=Ornithinibacillus halophilus TaxID=930117 RepID=A0A1M5L5S7_9BACI|nr:DUF4181 domain-containing protein [Ornithinibacillus halophilus]SHG60377.1 protein of unknown function [Ornithinibacillus halophilus]